NIKQQEANISTEKINNQILLCCMQLSWYSNSQLSRFLSISLVYKFKSITNTSDSSLSKLDGEAVT
ncbi:14411_t:CDS:1, partial [Ambispora leptoticha]